MAGRTDTFLSWLVCVALAAGTPLSGAEPRPVPPEAVDTVVVRPAAWAEALQPWKAYREAQGHRIAELDSAADSRTLRAAIAQVAAAQTEPIRYVLLAGDVSADAAVNIPTCYYDSSAMSQFGGDATIASDNPYADLDGDNVPELAIGRIPADSAEQLKKVLARVMAFEQHRDFSSWRRDVHVVAGVGGFGAIADSVIEMTTRRFLADRIPGWSELSMTQASVDSHYCPDPWRFSEACIDRMNQGGMFWVYIGHGHVKTLDYIRAGEDWLPILTHEHVPAVNVGSHPPIAVFLACYTGAFDAIEDSLAEELMLSPTGPIASLAASRVSGPYGLAMLSDGLLSSCFDEQASTLGDVVLHAKQGLLQDTPSEMSPPESGLPGAMHQTSNHTSGHTSGHMDQLQMIGAIASALSPSDYDLAAERREHVWQMNLLGDPLLRLCHPGPLALQVAERAAPGETIQIVGNSDVPGQLLVELVLRRDQVRNELDTLGVDLFSERGRAGFQQRYHAANQHTLLKQEQSLDGSGSFQVNLRVPADLPRGKYAVRAYLEGQAACRAGYCELHIRAPQARK
ncbi:MAG: C25 family cysteine peptidase [Pirellulaceae bacterium]